MKTILPAGRGTGGLHRLVATIISRLFDPPFVFTALMILIVLQSGMTSAEQVRFLLLFFVVIVGIPLALILAAIRRKTISDWDLGNRLQRVKALRILLGLAVMDLAIVYSLGNVYLSAMFTFFCVWLVGFAAITNWWKLSGHTGMAALASGFLTYWYGWWPALLIVPLIAWARIVRHDHSPAQTVVGALYSWAVLGMYILLLPFLQQIR